MDDEAFLVHVGERLAGLPAVEAVTLGGSRAEGVARPDSDWDVSVWYRGRFAPQALRDLGWPGQVAELGGWSAVPGGAFNGGARLTVDGRRTDVHYRDLDVLHHVVAEAERGRFEIEPLWFHLAGLPSYFLLAELATRRILVGDLPAVPYPAALRRAAPVRWWEQAEAELDYARRYHATAGRLTPCLGLVARATACAAHAVLAARGAWITNEKQLLVRAGLTDVDALLAGARSEPESLVELVDAVRARCAREVTAARA